MGNSANCTVVHVVQLMVLPSHASPSTCIVHRSGWPRAPQVGKRGALKEITAINSWESIPT
jgi:hypothetical protein